jgi:hypothetical protein
MWYLGGLDSNTVYPGVLYVNNLRQLAVFVNVFKPFGGDGEPGLRIPDFSGFWGRSYLNIFTVFPFLIQRSTLELILVSIFLSMNISFAVRRV